MLTMQHIQKSRSLNDIYLLLSPCRVGESCDEHVCLSVCPQAYLQNYTPSLHQFFVHVTYGHGSVLLWWHYKKLSYC